MSKADRPKLLLIVTGSTLRAEEMDRPLAYYLKQQVEQSVADRPVDGMALHVLVVADFRWLHDEPLQRLPTISVGGPGVNALARQWFEEDLPNSLVVDGRYFVQMDPELAEPRASVWGMDNASTQFAVSAFLSRFLSRFLRRCADDDIPGLIEADSDSDADPE
ncbi:MAG: hypothetical protein U0800_28005 [Isosphaeraceae bacterium]